jgi:2OG-Fe(II) oxygenase superfamily
MLISDSAEVDMASTIRPVENFGTLRAHYLVIDDFLPTDIAAAMRQDIDAHFGNTGSHRPETHQVWNYWFVPSLYTYLRTSPNKVIRPECINQFMGALKVWSGKNLGMKEISHPYLSLYVNGCRQGLHNDAKNGRFAFVYSLTRNERRTVGGQTIVLHEGDLFRTKLKTPAAGASFYTQIEPRFNRLIVFDDRIPHGVERVEGPMDPVEGRFVLHGHIREAGPIIDGALVAATVNKVVTEAMGAFLSKATAGIGECHGPLVMQLTIDALGDVETCHIVVDRVIDLNPTGEEWDIFLENLGSFLKAIKFPPSDGATTVMLPIMFGGPLR